MTAGSADNGEDRVALQPISHAVTPQSRYNTPASRAQQRQEQVEDEKDDEELNVMAIKEYITTRTKMESKELDKDGKIISNGMSPTDSPVQDKGLSLDLNSTLHSEEA